LRSDLYTVQEYDQKIPHCVSVRGVCLGEGAGEDGLAAPSFTAGAEGPTNAFSSDVDNQLFFIVRPKRTCQQNES